MFEKRIDLQEVAKRGHWGGLLGVKRYEKHARLLKVLNDMSERQRCKASKLGFENRSSPLLCTSLDDPPTHRWFFLWEILDWKFFVRLHLLTSFARSSVLQPVARTSRPGS